MYPARISPNHITIFCYSCAMRVIFGAIKLAAIAAFAATLCAAQQFTPKAIQFSGVPEYNSSELLAVAQLTPGTQIDAADLDKHAKLLMETGNFGSYAYSFDGENLIFTLTPSPNLYPVRFANLPFTLTPQVMANIHARAPLFHGKVPAQGGTLDSLIAALEAEFATHGTQATVAASAYFDPKLNTVTAMQLTVTAPQVLVSAVNVHGVSPQLDADLKKIYTPLTGSAYKTDETTGVLQDQLEDFYFDHGYATAKISVAKSDEPVYSADKVEVPLNVIVQEGRVYKVGLIKLNSRIYIQQRKIDTALHPHEGDPITGAGVRSLMDLIDTIYESKGYMECKVTRKVNPDERSATADYTIDVAPGPQFTMGDLTFEGFPDDLAQSLKGAWKTPRGAPVDFPYVRSYVLSYAERDQAAAAKLSAAKLSYFYNIDPKTHVVNITYRFGQ